MTVSDVIMRVTGELLSTVDTRHMNNTYGCVSPCGRFVASSGLTLCLILNIMIYLAVCLSVVLSDGQAELVDLVERLTPRENMGICTSLVIKGLFIPLCQ